MGSEGRGKGRARGESEQEGGGRRVKEKTAGRTRECRSVG